MLDLGGQIVVPFEWDLIGVFDTAGLCYAEKGDRRCWLNRQGNVVLELPPEVIVSDAQFDSAGFLSARRASCMAASIEWATLSSTSSTIERSASTKGTMLLCLRASFTASSIDREQRSCRSSSGICRHFFHGLNGSCSK